MKKNLFWITAFMLIFCVISVYGQDSENSENAMDVEDTLAQQFSSLKIRERFDNYSPIAYYRFSPDVMFYEPIDLSYFPHENWNKNNWIMLGRWADGKTYNQLLYTETPVSQKVIHGTSTGESRGFLRDFYLYITLFIEDNYPADTGSCYVYYSDSMMIGLKESKGLLIDPESGIYEATNSYGGTRHTTYTPSSIHQKLDILQELDPADYAITDKNIENSSIGASQFTESNLDETFASDWQLLQEDFRMISSPEVKAYRIEVIRMDGISSIYINGKKVFSAVDNMRTPNEEGILNPERVSWSYGPILNEGGMTVTCSVGDFIIYSPGN